MIHSIDAVEKLISAGNSVRDYMRTLETIVGIHNGNI